MITKIEINTGLVWSTKKEEEYIFTSMHFFFVDMWIVVIFPVWFIKPILDIFELLPVFCSTIYITSSLPPLLPASSFRLSHPFKLISASFVPSPHAPLSLFLPSCNGLRRRIWSAVFKGHTTRQEPSAKEPREWTWVGWGMKEARRERT